MLLKQPNWPLKILLLDFKTTIEVEPKNKPKKVLKNPPNENGYGEEPKTFIANVQKMSTLNFDFDVEHL